MSSDPHGRIIPFRIHDYSNINPFNNLRILTAYNTAHHPRNSDSLAYGNYVQKKFAGYEACKPFGLKKYSQRIGPQWWGSDSLIT